LLHTPALVHLTRKILRHAPGTHESIVGVRLPAGAFKSRLTAESPKPLAAALTTIIGDFTTHSSSVQLITDWQTPLPPKLTWPLTHHRVEDGGGLSSSTLCMAPVSIPLMQQLRSKWFSRLTASKDCLKIVSKLRQGDSTPPLSALELEPYLRDSLGTMGVDQPSAELLQVTPGQPFRLRLWKTLVCVMTLIQFFFDVNKPLTPSLAWPVNQVTMPADMPLVECTSSWKSASDHLDLVRELISEEVAAGFNCTRPWGHRGTDSIVLKSGGRQIGYCTGRRTVTTIGCRQLHLQRVLDGDSMDALHHWQDVLSSTWFCISRERLKMCQCRPPLMPWFLLQLRAWEELLSSLMAHVLGSNFVSLWPKHSRCGHGSDQICRNILQFVNFWLNLF